MTKNINIFEESLSKAKEQYNDKKEKQKYKSFSNLIWDTIVIDKELLQQAITTNEDNQLNYPNLCELILQHKNEVKEISSILIKEILNSKELSSTKVNNTYLIDYILSEFDTDTLEFDRYLTKKMLITEISNPNYYLFLRGKFTNTEKQELILSFSDSEWNNLLKDLKSDIKISLKEDINYTLSYSKIISSTKQFNEIIKLYQEKNIESDVVDKIYLYIDLISYRKTNKVKGK